MKRTGVRLKEEPLAEPIDLMERLNSQHSCGICAENYLKLHRGAGHWLRIAALRSAWAVAGRTALNSLSRSQPQPRWRTRLTARPAITFNNSASQAAEVARI
jgi:hypothetical protein